MSEPASRSASHRSAQNEGSATAETFGHHTGGDLDFFAGPLVATRPIWCTERRVLVLPSRWWTRRAYAVTRTPTFEDDERAQAGGARVQESPQQPGGLAGGRNARDAREEPTPGGKATGEPSEQLLQEGGKLAGKLAAAREWETLSWRAQFDPAREAHAAPGGKVHPVQDAPGWDGERARDAQADGMSSEDDGPPSRDWRRHNEAMMAQERVEELAWEVSGVVQLELRIFGITLREVCLLSWKPCWVPLHWAAGEQGGQFAASLLHHRQRWLERTDEGKAAIAVWCTAALTKFLAACAVDRGWSPKLHKVSAYAEITADDGRVIRMVKAVWAHSWEHTGHLARERKLWRQLLKQREIAGKRLLKTGLDAKSSELVLDFLRVVDADRRRVFMLE